MSFSRWWTETTAALGEHVPLPLAVLALVAATALAATGWYTYPAWVPRRLPRLRRQRRPVRPTRPASSPVPATDAGPADAPVPVAPAAAALADLLAGQGRYDEAIRERLRAMLHDLAERRVVRVRPGMTVTEVVAATAASRPSAGPPLAAAANIFSEVWYAQRPPTAEHDHRMRDHAARLRRLLADEPTDEVRLAGAATAAGSPPAVIPAPRTGTDADGPPTGRSAS